MLNKVILIGRLTRDPELKYIPNGTAVATFSLAVDRKFNRDEVDFVDIVAWKQLAENCANYLGKGRLAAVEGRLQVRNYEAKDGSKRKTTEVVADDVRFLDGKGKGQAGGSPAAGAAAVWDDLARPAKLEDIDVADDDIPF